MGYWEAIAVILGVTYLLLAVRENITCWYAAFISSAIFLVLFWDVNLLMESALQVYYVVMAVYGWWQWRHGDEADKALQIQRWRPAYHVGAIGLIIVAAGVSGALLSQHTDAALPYLDSFTTWGAIFTTWMVTQKILENWLYWLIIDAASIVLYLDRELYLTAGLFVIYIIIAIYGFRQWLQSYRIQHA